MARYAPGTIRKWRRFTQASRRGGWAASPETKFSIGLVSSAIIYRVALAFEPVKASTANRPAYALVPDDRYKTAARDGLPLRRDCARERDVHHDPGLASS